MFSKLYRTRSLVPVARRSAICVSRSQPVTSLMLTPAAMKYQSQRGIWDEVSREDKSEKKNREQALNDLKDQVKSKSEQSSSTSSSNSTSSDSTSTTEDLEAIKSATFNLGSKVIRAAGAVAGSVASMAKNKAVSVASSAAGAVAATAASMVKDKVKEKVVSSASNAAGATLETARALKDTIVSAASSAATMATNKVQDASDSLQDVMHESGGRNAMEMSQGRVKSVVKTDDTDDVDGGSYRDAVLGKVVMGYPQQASNLSNGKKPGDRMYDAGMKVQQSMDVGNQTGAFKLGQKGVDDRDGLGMNFEVNDGETTKKVGINHAEPTKEEKNDWNADGGRLMDNKEKVVRRNPQDSEQQQESKQQPRQQDQKQQPQHGATGVGRNRRDEDVNVGDSYQAKQDKDEANRQHGKNDRGGF